MAADCKSAAPCGLRRFESSPVHRVLRIAHVAQMAERSPGKDSSHVAQLVERVLGKDEVTSSILVVGSSAGVTQWLESRPSKPLVAGSNPVSRSFIVARALRDRSEKYPWRKRNSREISRT